jgi:hypothetical protein
MHWIICVVHYALCINFQLIFIYLYIVNKKFDVQYNESHILLLLFFNNILHVRFCVNDAFALIYDKYSTNENKNITCK